MLQPRIYKRTYQKGEMTLTLGERTLIMGIVNVTPDSFSDGGQFYDVERAVTHALELYEQGADMIDIGGESTRPGHTVISDEEEITRVVPVIKAISERAPHIPISIDTYKSEVARAALEAGAHIINDIWGCKADPHMAELAKEKACPIILMHNRDNTDYSDFVSDALRDVQESIDLALAAGVDKNHIILDPGIGFAKSYEQNLLMMASLGDLANLGYPVLLATSRKRFIRNTLNLPVDDLVEGTAATVAFGIAQGSQMVRVHDVAKIKRTVDMCDAMLYQTLKEMK
ncbi:dihydropteroate synthase [Paenibacillus urinalis]|uniref:Dihydropteroate synthase n=1 Tax=Paenibacillus urinalis TaxID=521520 RepID=A0ABY7XCE5_9BACL|nr:dihydropteroate synthase [Paenibacillus urinalis]WDH98823.1 dihydropteroate synthase [Paenibacillus urinalis]WDI02519.1 dihydropteroate synthase [Paenibacillus urinalis]